MSKQLEIQGHPVKLEWNNETARRFRYRLGTVGGHPAVDDMTNPATAESAYVKILWALLPSTVASKFKTPEDLFAVLDDDDAPLIFAAVADVYSQMEASAEKKSVGKKNPSPKSS